VGWTWAAATCRGTSHVRDGTDCQDVSRCLAVGAKGETLVAVVSDGAGSAQFGGQGAAVACRSISESARDHFASTSAQPSDDEIWSWIDAARDRIGNAAIARAIELRQFASTLVAVFATRTDTLVLHIGDGAAVIRTDERWIVPSWPANGEYASTTYFLTDEPSPQLRITRQREPVQAVAVFSDGVERLALNFSDKSAHGPFFDGIFKPLWNSKSSGHNNALTSALRRYLDSEAINQRTDDDKSLVLAARL
jgi:hypothetical protein